MTSNLIHPRGTSDTPGYLARFTNWITNKVGQNKTGQNISLWFQERISSLATLNSDRLLLNKYGAQKIELLSKLLLDKHEAQETEHLSKLCDKYKAFKLAEFQTKLNNEHISHAEYAEIAQKRNFLLNGKIQSFDVVFNNGTPKVILQVTRENRISIENGNKTADKNAYVAQLRKFECTSKTPKAVNGINAKYVTTNPVEIDPLELAVPITSSENFEDSLETLYNESTKENFKNSFNTKESRANKKLFKLLEKTMNKISVINRRIRDRTGT